MTENIFLGPTCDVQATPPREKTKTSLGDMGALFAFQKRPELPRAAHADGEHPEPHNEFVPLSKSRRPNRNIETIYLTRLPKSS